MTRRKRTEGEAIVDIAAKPVIADPVPGDNGAALSRIVAFFKATFPEEWESLRLCPLQHGVEAMAEKLDS